MAVENPTEGQEGFAGQEGITTGSSRYNSLRFLIFQAMGEAATVKIVQVKKVDDEAETVSVQPLVMLMNGARETMSHATIFNIPYAKVQAGRNQITMVPQVNDIGIMVCADRDISAVKKAKKEAPPGSFRRMHISDGMYLMGLFGEEDPNQFIEFNDDGITIQDRHDNKIEMITAGIKVNGSLFDRLGNLNVPGTVTWNGGTLGSGGANVAGDFKAQGQVYANFGAFNQIRLSTHTHTSAGAGSPTSSPTPGS